MNEQDIQDILVALLTEDSVQLGERSANAEPTLEAVSTFEEAGVASDKRGLVVSTGDGSVFLVTIERGGVETGATLALSFEGSYLPTALWEGGELEESTR